jgi:hypothetical protein
VIIQFGGNTLDCDVETTIAAFKAYTPHLCDCNGCRNFRTAHKLIFDQATSKIFEQFGIDTAKPAEIFTLGSPDESSLLRYGGWFHFIGEAISYDDVIDVSEHLEVYFLTRPALLPASFKCQPAVQMEFEWKIPWVLPEPWS